MTSFTFLKYGFFKGQWYDWFKEGVQVKMWFSFTEIQRLHVELQEQGR